MDELRAFFNSYIPNSDCSQLIQAFDAKRHLNRREFLLKPGQASTFLGFIKTGTCRVFFYNADGVEVTVWFSFKGMMIGDLLAFFKGTSAQFYVQAIEESEVWIVQKEKLEYLFQENPDYLQFGRKYAENVSIQVMERMLSLQTLSAEERYEELLLRPQFLRSIPLKYLASFIGVTDTSLSRIRRNLG